MVGESIYQCWDNSTGGLDSDNALDFLKALQQYTKITGAVAVVTLYQASQAMYNVSLFYLCTTLPGLLHDHYRYSTRSACFIKATRSIWKSE